MATGVVPDLLALLKLPHAPISQSAVLVILACSIGLTLLQLHWAVLIVRQATGGNKPPPNRNKTR